MKLDLTDREIDLIQFLLWGHSARYFIEPFNEAILIHNAVKTEKNHFTFYEVREVWSKIISQLINQGGL